MKKHFLTLFTVTSLCSLFLAPFSVQAQIPNYVPTNGLVGWWPFNGNANDESGNGNNGTVSGATLTADRFGNANKAYSFDGVDDFIEVSNSNSITLTGNITMSAWIKTNGINGQNYQTILSKRETYWTWEYSFSLSYHNNVIHNTKVIGSRALGQGNQEQGWSSSSYNTNSWENWVISINNGQMQIYKNGSLDTSLVFLMTPQSQNCPLLFGRNTLVDFSEQFYGNIDDIGIWNRALTACEIQDLYNAELNSLAVNGGPDQELCKGQSTSLFGTGASTYQWSNNVQNGVGFVPTVTNPYILTGTDANGCVGTDTVIVTVNEVSSSTQTQTALDSYTWPVNGQIYTESGTYTDTLTNSAGCDSIVTLNLTLSYTGIEELNPSVKKQLSKITDLNGKETPFRKNTILLFIFDDGTVKRVFEGE